MRWTLELDECEVGSGLLGISNDGDVMRPAGGERGLLLGGAQGDLAHAREAVMMMIARDGMNRRVAERLERPAEGRFALRGLCSLQC
jgi:hypothetical protein